MTTDQEEGARSFARFIEHVSEGDANRHLSEELHKLMRAMRQHVIENGGVAGGGLELKLGFKLESNGLVNVAYAIKRNEPKPRRPVGAMWLTKGNNLTHKNPRQMEMPLRRVDDYDPETGEIVQAGDDSQRGPAKNV